MAVIKQRTNENKQPNNTHQNTEAPTNYQLRVCMRTGIAQQCYQMTMYKLQLGKYGRQRLEQTVRILLKPKMIAYLFV